VSALHAWGGISVSSTAIQNTCLAVFPLLSLHLRLFTAAQGYRFLHSTAFQRGFNPLLPRLEQHHLFYLPSSAGSRQPSRFPRPSLPHQRTRAQRSALLRPKPSQRRQASLARGRVQRPGGPRSLEPGGWMGAHGSCALLSSSRAEPATAECPLQAQPGMLQPSRVQPSFSHRPGRTSQQPPSSRGTHQSPVPQDPQPLRTSLQPQDTAAAADNAICL